MIKYMYLASRLMKQNKSSRGSAVKNAFILSYFIIENECSMKI